MELIKESKIYNKKQGHQYIPAYTETDMNIPDSKPDIGAIVSEDAMVCINSVESNNGKLTLEMEANISVIYRGIDESVHVVRSKHNFRQIVDSCCMGDALRIVEEIKKTQVEAIIINSRKLGIRLSIGVDLKHFSKEEIEYIADSNEPGFEKKSGMASMKMNDFVGSGSLSCKSVFAIPVGHSSIAEILKLDMIPVNLETKAAGNKVLIKGDLQAKMLYMGEDGMLNSLENTFGLSEIVSLENEFEAENLVRGNIAINKIYYIIGQDDDGENRLVDIETDFRATFYQSKMINFEFVADMFGIKDELELTNETCQIPNIAFEKEEKIAVNASLQAERQISNIHDVAIWQKTLSSQMENGNLNVHGELEVRAVFLMDGELHCARQTISYDKPIFIGECEDIDIDSKIDNITFNLNLAGEIEIAASVILTLTSENHQSFTYLTNAEVMEKDAERANRPYSMRVYYVKEGDCAWSIAKKYKVCQSDLIEENGENLYKGQKLLIQG